LFAPHVFIRAYLFVGKIAEAHINMQDVHTCQVINAVNLWQIICYIVMRCCIATFSKPTGEKSEFFH
jgi:hypothetical protein